MADDRKRPVVHVRVMADQVVAEVVATEIGELLEQQGYEVIEQSQAYPCRAPDENQTRVYLTVR
jgi:hypothetical protein